MRDDPVRILQGHVLDKLRELADNSVHCIVTSPPYWGLRDYGTEALVWPAGTNTPHRGVATPACNHQWGDELPASGSRGCDTKPGAWQNHGNKDRDRRQRSAFCGMCGAWCGSHGLEPRIDLYIRHEVEIFRECRRMLHPSGVCFVDIGDSYGSAWSTSRVSKIGLGSPDAAAGDTRQDRLRGGPKEKDRCLIPFRLALALQDDGWWVRDVICWHKKAPMPESVGDRCTQSWEPILMLTKSAKYFWDAEAVTEAASEDSHARTAGANSRMFQDRDPGHPSEREARGVKAKATKQDQGGRLYAGFNGRYTAKQNASFAAACSAEVLPRRNLRNVWSLGPEPYGEAHFAVFPTEIPRRCILAATSAKGVCPKCLAPWRRVTEPSDRYKKFLGHDLIGKQDVLGRGRSQARGVNAQNKMRHETGQCCAEYITTGWQPTCRCAEKVHAVPTVSPNYQPIPATVLDPFAGSGTTGAVALELGRHAVLVELNPRYVALIEKRLAEVTAGLRLA